MMAEKNNKNLDELISGAIGRDKPKFDFDKWKQKHKKEIETFKSQVKPNLVPFETNIIRVTLWQKVGYIAASILIISSLVANFVLSRKNTDLKVELELARRDIAATPIDDSVTINFYLKEHQDFIARQASLNSAASQPVQMRVSQHDLLYCEMLDDQPEYISPAFIVKGPSFQREISSSETPAISNGQTLTLAEARKGADFNLVAPPWLRPGYSLEQIRRIDGHDALQLLYTDGINSVSLFEQPLDRQGGLEPKDLREYAVYRNKGQVGGTILAWRDDTLSYVLIGNADMSQLIDMAQSINSRK